jgi:hypothetical protein
MAGIKWRVGGAVGHPKARIRGEKESECTSSFRALRQVSELRGP